MWKEYMLNKGKGESISLLEENDVESINDNFHVDIINNWEVHMLDLIHEKEKECNIDSDECECLNSIKESLMDCSDKLDILSYKLDDVIETALKLR